MVLSHRHLSLPLVLLHTLRCRILILRRLHVLARLVLRIPMLATYWTHPEHIFNHHQVQVWLNSLTTRDNGVDMDMGLTWLTLNIPAH